MERVRQTLLTWIAATVVVVGMVTIGYGYQVRSFHLKSFLENVEDPQTGQSLSTSKSSQRFLSRDLQQFLSYSIILYLIGLATASIVAVAFIKDRRKDEAEEAASAKEGKASTNPTDQMGDEVVELLKQKNETIRNLKRLSSLGEMSTGIAHEIKSPLAAIQVAAQVTAQTLKASEPRIEKLANSIVSNCKRITTIIRGVEALARNADHDPFENVNVSDLISGTLAICKPRLKREKVDLKVDCHHEGMLSCRSAQISQVLVNLINNALDAIADSSDKWIEIKASLEGDSWRISVTDGGKGIPDEVAAKIMDSYYTTKPPGKGTGVGLSISKKIIEDVHNGKFYLDGACENTRFILEVPAVQQSSRAFKPPSHAAA